MLSTRRVLLIAAGLLFGLWLRNSGVNPHPEFGPLLGQSAVESVTRFSLEFFA